VDHLDKVRTNNALSNLHYVSQSFNNRNRCSQKGVDYTFVDEIPDESIVVNDYVLKSGEKRLFDDLYYYNDNFYWFNGLNYRMLHITEYKNGSLTVSIRDSNHKLTAIYYSKFKRQYDLI
jgi:hypothetical protein